jgi:hypothetical protein
VVVSPGVIRGRTRDYARTERSSERREAHRRVGMDMAASFLADGDDVPESGHVAFTTGVPANANDSWSATGGSSSSTTAQPLAAQLTRYLAVSAAQTFAGLARTPPARPYAPAPRTTHEYYD